MPVVIITVIIHNHNITQTDKPRVNYFEAARMIQAKKRSTTGFDEAPFILSLKRTTKTIRKPLNIISLQFLILP